MTDLPSFLDVEAARSNLTEQEVRALWTGLTDLQQAWLLKYVQNGLNATQAAKDAGYQCSSNASYRQQGFENRRHRKIRPLLLHVMSRHMSVDEALTRLTSIARGSMADFLSFDDRGRAVPDLYKARQQGSLHLIKEIKFNRRHSKDTGGKVIEVSSIKLHDPLKALVTILRTQGAISGSMDSYRPSPSTSTPEKLADFDWPEVETTTTKD